MGQIDYDVIQLPEPGPPQMLVLTEGRGQAQGIGSGLGQEGSSVASSSSRAAFWQPAMSLWCEKHTWKS